MTIEDEARAKQMKSWEVTDEAWDAFNAEPFMTNGIQAVYDAGVRAGASRQPSDAIPSHHDADYSPELFEKMQALLVEASGSPTLALRLVLSRQPSEADSEALHNKWVEGWNAAVTEIDGDEPSEAEVEAIARSRFNRERPGNEYADLTWTEVRSEYLTDARSDLEAARTARGEQHAD